MHALVNIHGQALTQPLRIISLVPSQTELLFDLGLDDEVVGITKFCVHPNEWFKTKTRIGGTKNINLEKVKSLAPNLILANKEENVREQVMALAAHYPVYISDINDIVSAYTMIEDIGRLTHTGDEALSIINDVKNSLVEISSKQKALYLIWNNPYMCAGQDTFITQMMAVAGFKNVVTANRYPSLTDDEIILLQPEIILLSSEPFPFKEKHIMALQLLVPNAKVILVDGEIFSWYGSRMLHAANYFSTLHTQLNEQNI
jgi:ABC-type Fe3+-hydroxamate transport system substrate-binding protein